MLCYLSVDIVKKRFRIDNSLDVLAVHGVGGATGTLLAAFFATAALGGIGLAEGVTVFSQFGVQLIGAVATLDLVGRRDLRAHQGHAGHLRAARLR